MFRVCTYRGDTYGTTILHHLDTAKEVQAYLKKRTESEATVRRMDTAQTYRIDLLDKRHLWNCIRKRQKKEAP